MAQAQDPCRHFNVFFPQIPFHCPKELEVRGGALGGDVSRLEDDRIEMWRILEQFVLQSTLSDHGAERANGDVLAGIGFFSAWTASPFRRWRVLPL